MSAINTQLKQRPLQCEAAFNPQVPNFLHRVFQARGIGESQSLNYTLGGLLPPQLQGIKQACERIEHAIRNQESILIVGDFDADGATSTAVAIRALTAMGAKKTGYLVPNRFEFGYGLSPEIVDVAAERNPDLIITVDNGISSFAGVERAEQHGIDVIITDHHLPAPTLPKAYAIINPNLQGEAFPSKHLAGVGVVFYLLIALRAHLTETGWFAEQSIESPNLAAFLDLVALGTVADVVVLDENNRILVDQGLKRIRAGQGCAGIQALLSIGKRHADSLVASDLGFAVAPRLNAAGRLEDISVGIECLLTDDAEYAKVLAQRLDAINQERRSIEQSMKEEAFAALESAKELAKTEQTQAGVCLYQASWHQGVIGILASRIKDALERPTVIFADDKDGFLKGSGRSVQGFHIRDAFERLSTQYPELIRSFGGHAMAAGLSIHQNQLDDFKHAFAALVDEVMGDDLGKKVIWTDGSLPPDLFTLRTAELIQQYGPWGQGFPEPVFEGEFVLLEHRIVGEHHLKMVVQTGERVMDAIAFNQTGEQLSQGRSNAVGFEAVQTIRMAYTLDINLFRGRRSLQLMVRYLEPVKLS